MCTRYFGIFRLRKERRVVEAPDEGVGFHLERDADLKQRLNGRIALPAFHLSVVGSVHVAEGRSLFLPKPELFTASPQPPPQDSRSSITRRGHLSRCGAGAATTLLFANEVGSRERVVVLGQEVRLGQSIEE
jgi:hypothetical protein